MPALMDHKNQKNAESTHAWLPIKVAISTQIGRAYVKNALDKATNLLRLRNLA
jgi:hypothetical protein